MNKVLTDKQESQKKQLLTQIGYKLTQYMLNGVNVNFQVNVAIHQGGIRESKYAEEGKLN